MTKKWSAEDLCARLKTQTQAKHRIDDLERMIGKRRFKIKQSEIMLAKYLKEMKLIREKFDLETNKE